MAEGPKLVRLRARAASFLAQRRRPGWTVTPRDDEAADTDEQVDVPATPPDLSGPTAAMAWFAVAIVVLFSVVAVFVFVLGAVRGDQLIMAAAGTVLASVLALCAWTWRRLLT